MMVPFVMKLLALFLLRVLPSTALEDFVWHVASGPCTLESDGCIRAGKQNNSSLGCEVLVENRKICEIFLEGEASENDKLEVDGIDYSSSKEKPGHFVPPISIHWTPSGEQSGKICLECQVHERKLTTWMMPSALDGLVPNVGGYILWVKEMVVGLKWKSPPQFWAPTPFRLLPALEDIPSWESKVRTEFWGSVVLLSPVAMAVLCEMTRLMFLQCKSASSSETYRALALAPVKDEPLDPEAPVGSTSAAISVDPCSCFEFSIVLYHLFCAGLIAVAFQNGWISSAGGGSFAWELWALWQQTCLWALFLQNLTRCTTQNADALRASTFKTVLLYTVPLLSELSDSMKDWVIVGFCFTQNPSEGAIDLGLLLICLEICGLRCGVIPRSLTITEKIRVAPPLFMLLGGYVLCVGIYFFSFAGYWAFYVFYYCVVAVIVLIIGGLAWGCAGIFMLFVALVYLAAGLLLLILSFFLQVLIFIGEIVIYVLCIGLCNVGESDCVCCWWDDWTRPVGEGVTTYQKRFNDFATWLYSDLNGESVQQIQRAVPKWLIALSDGGLLGLAAMYVIVFSYFQVALHEECKQDLHKTYMAILKLPLKPLKPVPETTWEWLAREASNQLVDFLSSSRLLIAWTEDIPQGIIGILLIVRFSIPHAESGGTKSLGFAAGSALISFLKGGLIPALQLYVFAQRKADVKRSLDLLVDSQEALQKLVDTLEEASTRILRGQLGKLLQGSVARSL